MCHESMGNPEGIRELEAAYESGDARRMEEAAKKFDNLLEKDEEGELLRALQSTTTFVDARDDAVENVLDYAIFENKGENTKTREDLVSGNVSIRDLDITTHEGENKKENRRMVKDFLAIISAANLVLDMMNNTQVRLEEAEEEEQISAEPRLQNYLETPTRAKAITLFETDQALYNTFCASLYAGGMDEETRDQYNELISLYTGAPLSVVATGTAFKVDASINEGEGMAYNDGEWVIELTEGGDKILLEFGKGSDALRDELAYGSEEVDSNLWENFENNEGFRYDHGGPEGLRAFLENDTKDFVDNMDEYQDLLLQIFDSSETTGEDFGAYLTVYSEHLQQLYTTGSIIDHNPKAMEHYVTWMDENMDTFGQSVSAEHRNPLVDIVGNHMDPLNYGGVDPDLAKYAIDDWTAVWSNMANAGQSLKLQANERYQQRAAEHFKQIFDTQNKGMMNMVFDVLRNLFGPEVVGMLGKFLGEGFQDALKEAYSLSSEELAALDLINDGTDFRAGGPYSSIFDNLVDAAGDDQPGGFDEQKYLDQLQLHSATNIQLVDPQFAAEVVGSMASIPDEQKKQMMAASGGFMSATSLKPDWFTRLSEDQQDDFWSGVLNHQGMQSELVQHKERRVTKSTEAKQVPPIMSAQHVASGVLSYAFNPSSLDGHETGQWSHVNMYGGVDVTAQPPANPVLDETVTEPTASLPEDGFDEVSLIIPPAIEAVTGRFQFGADSEGNLVLVEAVEGQEGNIEQKIIPDFGVEDLVNYPKLISGEIMMTQSEELYLLVAEKYQAEIAKTEGKDEQYITEVENILVGYIKGQDEGSELLAGITSEDDKDVLSGALTVVTDENEQPSFVIGSGDTAIPLPFEKQEEVAEDDVEDEDDGETTPTADGTTDAPDGTETENPSGTEVIPAAGVATEFNKLTDTNDPKFVMRKLFLREIGKAETWNKDQNRELLSLDGLSGEYTGLKAENMNYDKRLAVGSSFTVPSTPQENTDLENASYTTETEKKPFNTYVKDKIDLITNPIVHNAVSNLVFGKNSDGVPGLQRMLISAGHDTGGVNVYGPKTDEALDKFINDASEIS